MKTPGCKQTSAWRSQGTRDFERWVNPDGLWRSSCALLLLVDTMMYTQIPWIMTFRVGSSEKTHCWHGWIATSTQSHVFKNLWTELLCFRIALSLDKSCLLPVGFFSGVSFQEVHGNFGVWCLPVTASGSISLGWAVSVRWDASVHLMSEQRMNRERHSLLSLR